MNDDITLNDDPEPDFDTNDVEDLGFINTSNNFQKGVRKNIEEMLELRLLQKSINEVFDDED